MTPQRITLVTILLACAVFGAQTQNLGGNWMYVLHPDKAKALTVENSGELSIPNGKLFVFSKHRRAVTLLNGAVLSARTVGLAGGVQVAAGAKAQSQENIRLAQFQDPLVNLMESDLSNLPTFKMVELSGNEETTLSPGIYDSIFLSGNVKVTLKPGVYVIKHEFELSGQSSLTGSEVTLINGGEFRMDHNSRLTLTAPTAGALKDLVFFQPRANNRTSTLAGLATMTITGAVYLPTGTFSVLNSSQLTCTHLVAASVRVLNSGKLTLK